MKTGSTISILCTLFCLSAYADINPANPNQLDYLEASVEDLKRQVADLKQEVKEQGINPPAGPAVNGGCDIFINGDLLYWKANENGLGYVLKTKVIDQPNRTLGNGCLAAPHFDWDLGFRVGLGWNTNHDDWDLYLSWTRIHTAAHSHRHGDEHFLFAAFANPDFAENPILKASAYLKVHLNVLNWELGRTFYIGKHLSVRPHAGLQNTWISQHYWTKYHGNASFNLSPAVPQNFNNIAFRNHFWGVGARLGANTQWDLRWGVSFYGDVAWALLYGNFSLKRTSKVLRDDLAIHHKAHIDEKYAVGRGVMEFGLGFQWDYMLAHDRFHIGVKAGWEQHIYFGQNQIFTLVDQARPGKIISSNDDLSFQGLTFSIRLDL